MQRSKTSAIVAKNIKRLRNAQGLSAEALARAAGLSSVRMIESQKTPGSIPALEKIAKVLGVGIADLFVDPDPQPRSQALNDFLESPIGKDATKEEVEELEKARFRGEPTAITYFHALQALRSQAKKGG